MTVYVVEGHRAYEFDYVIAVCSDMRTAKKIQKEWIKKEDEVSIGKYEINKPIRESDGVMYHLIYLK